MTSSSPLKRTAPVFAFALLAMAMAARAGDCKPVLDALEKVNAQERFGTYEVEDDKSSPTPNGDYSVKIGKRTWQSVGGQTFSSDGTDADEHDIKAQMLKKQADAMNKVGCESLGTGTYRGTAVMRYRYPNLMNQRPMPAEYLKQRGLNEQQLKTILVYLDQKTGLPAYQEMYMATGIRMAHTYAYGDAVKEPAASGRGNK
jgi:hypothetical protein